MSRACDLLGPNGPLAQELSGYEHRHGQLRMAEAVERALRESRTLVCEAGTGTGKTLAYLVPALESGRKVVVSTATRALQDQIYFHDLPAIASHIGLRPDVALVKGLSNYLCLRRLDEFELSAEATSSRHARSLAVIERWAKETETGDVAEIVSLPEGDPTWSEVCSSSETRIGPKCSRNADCFVTRMRRRAEQARLLVANHHLVFADLALRAGSCERGGALPEYEAIIFDEAHQLEDIASDFFGVQVSTRRTDSLLRDGGRVFLRANLADPVLGTGEGLRLLQAVHEESKNWFAALSGAVDVGDAGRRTLCPDVWTGRLLQSYHRLDSALEALQRHAEAHARDENVQAIATRVGQLRADMEHIIAGGHSRMITWVEARARTVVLGSTPIDVASVLRAGLFERIPCVVLTSATLTSNTGFEFFRSRIGLDSPHVRTDELVVPSPFDFDSHALLYTPVDLPEPSDPRFVPMAAHRIAELIGITGGGAFVLCTSLRAMNALHDRLSGLLPRRPMLQGDAPKQLLLDRFRADGHAVLVATMSFWEGVDVAGEALRLVVIDKIPFAVPTDPVVQARCQALEEQGKNAFAYYQVPLAAMTLKQGFGRLIRTQRDRGIVAVLDRRLVARGYGKTLRNALPCAPRVESIEQVKEFWRTAFA